MANLARRSRRCLSSSRRSGSLPVSFRMAGDGAAASEGLPSAAPSFSALSRPYPALTTANMADLNSS